MAILQKLESKINSSDKLSAAFKKGCSDLETEQIIADCMHLLNQITKCNLYTMPYCGK